MDLPFKQRVLTAFRQALLARREEALRELALLDEAAAAETKSSAGDKYETAREMIAQSRSLQERGRAEAQAGLDWLDALDHTRLRECAGAGALVESDLGMHLLGLLTASVQIDAMSIQGITPLSPLGQVLKGKRAGDSFDWRNRRVTVLGIA
ncbi:MAG: hypothetical protein RL318_216 [Fibrobacterota bacterium]|jgi:hypothetical protein